jgi:simple sugar transport system permease protein
VRKLVYGLVAIAVALGVLMLLGAPPMVLIRGSIGSQFALTNTLFKSVPLMLAGLAVAIAFRAGVWNIGAEGQFIVGGIAALLASRYGIVLSLGAAMLAGAAWASLATLTRFWRGAPEVLTTILLNFIAIHLLGYCVSGPLQERAMQYPQTDAASADLPPFAGIVLAILACIVAWWILYRTAEGLRLRATGFNPFAARWAGVGVNGQIARAMGMSGAMAGLAGGIELFGVTHRLFERFASGYGYSGIAVALLAQLHPLGTIASALFFGALATGAGELQRSANISSAIATLGQAIVILVLITAGSLEGRRRWSN